MKLPLFIILSFVTGFLPLSGNGQDLAEKLDAVIIYELVDQYSIKEDANKVSPAMIPGLERQFYCLPSKMLYIEVAASQADQCEAYLNNRGVVYHLKKNCSLVRVEEQCSTVIKSEN